MQSLVRMIQIGSFVAWMYTTDRIQVCATS